MDVIDPLYTNAAISDRLSEAGSKQSKFSKAQDGSSEVFNAVDIETEEYDPEDFAPLSLSYIFGINRKLGARILNVAPNEHFCIYSLGHVASLLNLNAKTVHHFQGHETILISIEHDDKPHFVITADKDKLIIWDLGRLGVDIPMKLRTLDRPFGKDVDITATGISSCGKYIVTCSEKTSTGSRVQFWRWSFGQEECDGEFLICEKFGKIHSIKFSKNPDENEFFAVTLKNGVIFARWDINTEKLEVHTPEQKKFGIVMQSCYVPKRRTVASTTNHGRIIIWSDTLTQNSKEPVTNRKNFIKLINVQHPYSINDIKGIDGMLVTCNEIGEIRFYDVDIRLLYICRFWKESAVDFIAPVLVPKEIKLIDVDNFNVEENDRTQIVYKSTCPVDFSMEKKPFLVREFYAVARTGDVLYCNIFEKEAVSVLYRTSESLVSYDIVKHRPWVICANSNGKIIYSDYGNYQIIREQFLKQYTLYDEDEEKEVAPSISCIRISTDGAHLAIGYENGAIWMIDPLIITPLTPNPLRYSKTKIQDIVFSNHPACAYVASVLRGFKSKDANATVTLLRYDKEKMEWSLNGKYRHHHKPLILLSVVNQTQDHQYLLSLGVERHYIEYDLRKSLRKFSLEVRRELVLEQFGEFTAAVILKLSKVVTKDTSTNGWIILVADDQYKFKIFDLVTLDRLYMFSGPIYDAPVRLLVNYSEPHSFYSNMLIFATEKTLGCVVLPIDGNMFRYSGITAHPRRINMMVPYGTDIFACADSDVGGAIWNIDEQNVHRYFRSGGQGLAPFCRYIPGGKEGWYFKEMQDMFYYMQIMAKGGDAPEEHAVNDFIPVEDLPDYMRAIGFFPSEYEIQCILKEATRTTSPSIPPPTEISFEDAVMMYLNHKPVTGYELEDIKAAVEYLADQHSSDYITHEAVPEDEEVQVTLDRILQIMCKRGEATPEDMAKRYLIELLSDDTGKMKMSKLNVDAEFDELPEVFTVREICSELLGIELKDSAETHLEAQIGDQLDPAKANSQLENRFSIIVPESDIDVEKERAKDQAKNTLKQGRVIKVANEKNN